jgi:hypothetical protein
MASRAASSSGPAQSTTLRGISHECLVSLAGLESWLKRARAGDWLVYQRGPFMLHDEVTRRVGELARAGLVDPWQPLSPTLPGCRDFKAQRTSRALLPGGADAAPVAETDAAGDLILRALKRAANLGQRCPSDRELAALAGLPTKAAAQGRVRKLEAAGAFETKKIGAGPDAGWRWVVFPNGRHTMLPPGEAKLRASIAAQVRSDDAEGEPRGRLPKGMRRG